MNGPKGVKIFQARYVLPIDRPPLEDGVVLVREGRIAGVGRRHEVEVPAGAGSVDFGDAILLPPLVNAHTHLELTHFPLWAEDAGEGDASRASFVDWILHVIRIKRPLDPRRFVPSVAAGIRESLLAGTGAVGDILSWYPGREAYRESPLKGRFFLELLGRDPARNEALLHSALAVAQEGSVGKLQPALAPHSPYTVSADFLAEIFCVARQSGYSTTTHLGESLAETQFLAESRGDIASRLFPAVGWGDEVPAPSRLSPVGYLADRGGLASTNLLVHGVHVPESDIPPLAASGATVVLCPRSNARLEGGRAPVADYLSAGIPLALGTDSRASSDSLSVWDELAFAREVFAGQVSPQALLEIATGGGARALGLGQEMGALSVGAGAHFQVLKPATLPSLQELPEFLCAPGRTSEVAFLYLDGRDVLQSL